jgi:hypothetical protein
MNRKYLAIGIWLAASAITLYFGTILTFLAIVIFALAVIWGFFAVTERFPTSWWLDYAYPIVVLLFITFTSPTVYHAVGIVAWIVIWVNALHWWFVQDDYEHMGRW